MKLLGIIRIGFNVRDQLSIRFSAFIKNWKKKKKWKYNEGTSALHRLQESLRFSEEESIVQYSRSLRYP
jgi:hypothetical protein